MWPAVRVSVVCAVTAIVVGSPLASPLSRITDALTDVMPHEELTPTASSGCTVGTDEDHPFTVNIELQVTPRICCLRPAAACLVHDWAVMQRTRLCMAGTQGFMAKVRKSETVCQDTAQQLTRSTRTDARARARTQGSTFPPSQARKICRSYPFANENLGVKFTSVS
jgi:hypothetical protein